MENDEKRIRHLEMIQAVITRMASSSMTMKNYTLGVFTGGAALSRFLKAPEIMLASAGLIVLFWVLDAKYLQQEKWFRDLFDLERKKPDTKSVDFAITPTPKTIEKTTLSYGMNSWSTRWLYVPVFAASIFLWLYLRADCSLKQ